MHTSNNKPNESQNKKTFSDLTSEFQRAYNAQSTEEILSANTATFTQHSVMWMFDVLELNSFPQPIGQKSGIPWKKLQYTRLSRDLLMEAFHGRCNVAVMVGATSRGLFVIDCETEPLFKWVITELKQRQIPIWAVKSARGGHIWLRCSTGTVKSVSSVEFGIKLEVRGHTGYVLAPPSVHPTGAIYDWYERQGDVIPTVTPEQIDFLPLALELHKVTLKQPYARDYSPLWPTTQDYLKTGHLLAEGQRHERFKNAAVDYVRNGYGYAEIVRDLKPIAERSGLPDQDDPNYFNRIIGSITRKIQPRRKNTPRLMDWQRAQAFIASYTWQGRNGATDRALALALVDRAKAYSSENGTFRASYRELGGIARITDRRTIKKALQRLMAIPFILLAGADETSEASLWHFSNKAVSAVQVDAQTNLQTIDSDATERGAIGKSGVHIWRAMLALNTPATPAEIAAHARVSVKQVYYALRADGWLRMAALVSKTPNGWIASPATAEQLNNSVARPACKSGRGKARIQQFTSERATDASRQIIKWRLANDRSNFDV